ncbi:MAG: pseudouridine synthase [Bacteroidia bacterium]
MKKRNPKKRSITQSRQTTPISSNEDFLRLNRVLANAGYCSRREADELIKNGLVTVNGKSVTELGTKVGPDDEVRYAGEKVRREQYRYILLNKPKDFITTMDDPQGRKTVMDLVKHACKERVFPVGRLDRSTTGLMLLTNDGELSNRLAHPKNGIIKTYKVELDKEFKAPLLEKLMEGLTLEDGTTKCDEAFFPDRTSNKVVIVSLHSGKNRIVRRLFEHLEYKVLRLDRLSFAGITKGDLNRGKWRFLTDKEIGFLKMIK